MENKLTDLNNILFEQIERLNDDDLHGEALKQQIKRSQAIESVAGMIIANANTALKAEKLKMEYAMDDRDPSQVPEMLRIEDSRYRLTKAEWDILDAYVQESYPGTFKQFSNLMCMKEKGYFKNVDPDKELKEILANCVVIEHKD